MNEGLEESEEILIELCKEISGDISITKESIIREAITDLTKSEDDELYNNIEKDVRAFPFLRNKLGLPEWKKVFPVTYLSQTDAWAIAIMSQIEYTGGMKRHVMTKYPFISGHEYDKFDYLQEPRTVFFPLEKPTKIEPRSYWKN